jgi:preprotein translocase subunit SecY
MALIKNSSPEYLVLPLLISFVVLIIVIAMENAEKRIPLQRISIHNVYADKNYLSLKLNPMGVMPLMFSTAAFMLPQMAVQVLASAMPENERLKLLQDQLTLTHPVGIIVYIIIVYILTLGFSFVFINPKDYSDRLLKSGDSLVNIHAGRETARYLSKSLRNICIFSATVMSFCVGIPLYLQVKGSVDNTLMTMPSAVMMLTGVCCNLCREYRAVKSFDSYRPFI